MELKKDLFVLKELGYFSWDVSNPSNGKSEKHNISDLGWKELLKRLDIEAKPKELTNISELNSNLSTKEDFRLSDKFLNKRKNQVIIFWQYPYNLPPSIPCYVSSIRECNLSSIHFLVHGSVLGLLSGAKSTAKCESLMVQRLGGGNIINLRIVIEKNGFLGDAGHQFERLVVGDNPFSNHSRLQNHILRLIQIGHYKILVCAEADAVDPVTKRPVEIKTKNFMTETAYDRDKIKVILQMLSNGSETLITTDRVKHEDGSFTVKSVEKYSREELINSLSEGETTLNRKLDYIKSNLQYLYETVQFKDSHCYKMTFDKENKQLKPFQDNDSIQQMTQQEFQVLNSNFYTEQVLNNNISEK